MRARLVIGRVVIGVAAIAATGCGHALSQPMPKFDGRLGVTVANDRPSKMTEMPIGVHQIGDTAVYVSGHQGAAGVGVLFGPIGVAAAHAAAQSTGEKKTQDAQAQLRLDMPKLAEEILAEELARRAAEGRFAPSGATGDGRLEIVPYLVVNFIGEEQVRPWVVLKATLKDARGDEQWKTKYVAGVGEVRPLVGERGWVSDEGMPLRQHVDRNLRLAMDVLLRDASGALPRKTGRVVEVRTQWVWVKPFLERNAEVLEETEESLVVVPDVADAFVFAGVNILDKKAVTLKEPPK
jgi:hypothetical protein